MENTNDIKIGTRFKNTKHLKTKDIEDSILEIELKEQKCILICELKYANKNYVYADIIGAKPLEVKE